MANFRYFRRTSLGMGPSLGATGLCCSWVGLSASIDLQAVLTVLATGGVSHARIVASEMPH